MATIKAVALAVDGVLTDGTFCWGEKGKEIKRFHFAAWPKRTEAESR